MNALGITAPPGGWFAIFLQIFTALLPLLTGCLPVAAVPGKIVNPGPDGEFFVRRHLVRAGLTRREANAAVPVFFRTFYGLDVSGATALLAEAKT